MKKNVLLLVTLLALTTHHTLAYLSQDIKNAMKDSEYILCIDGGGSKTTLRVVTQQKEYLLLQNKKNTLRAPTITTGGSNIDTVKTACIEHVFSELFDGLVFHKNISTDNTTTSIPIPFARIMGQCSIIAGLAGASNAHYKHIIKTIFQKLGFSADKIVVCEDAELTLEYVDDPGVMLIAGTGSVCMGKDGEKFFQADGLGNLIGDKGSGYWIGINALNAALCCEQGSDVYTSLLERFKKFFTTEKLNDVVAPVHSGEITPTQIASLARMVFDEASNNDPVAQEIIANAKNILARLLKNVLTRVNKQGCTVHLHGGIFSSTQAYAFIEEMLSECRNFSPNIKNMADAHVPTEVVFKFLP